MTAARSTTPLLPPEDLANQLSTIEVLLSIYHGSSDLTSEDEEFNEDDGDIVLSPQTYTAIKNLAEFLSLPLESLGKPYSVQLRDSFPSAIQIGIKLDPLRGTLHEKAKKINHPLVLNVGFAIRRLYERKEQSVDETLKPICTLKHADWIDRSSFDALCTAATRVQWTQDENVDYIMNVIEAISEASLEHVQSPIGTDDRAVQEDVSSDDTLTTSSKFVLRCWYLLPSLSMKDKRKDLVSYATSNNLTGFVLAGKPGLVVLECDISQGEVHATKYIDSYWSEIKTTSWSDLPSSHKKVSERYREKDVNRCFTNVRDITSIDALGGMDVEEGGRIRTPDLDRLKSWLELQGCNGQLDVVLGKDASV